MRCPTPKKVRYPDQKDAQTALGALRGRGQRNLKAYRCQCGAWHLGRRYWIPKVSGRMYSKTNRASR